MPSRTVKHWWVSCPKFTVYVRTQGYKCIIVDAAPVTRKFIGQPLTNLINWFDGFGEATWQEISIASE